MPPSPTIGNRILELLESHHLVSAPMLVELLRPEHPSVNKTTVYRALDKLLLDGHICRQHLQNNDLVYERRDHHHDHLVCTVCGSITTAECQIHLDHLANFQVQHHHLTLYGVCEHCQNSTTPTSAE